jgi:hypothetical protein
MILQIFCAFDSESEPPESGYKSVAGRPLRLHAEIGAMMPHKLIEFFEGAFVEQQINSFARSQFARFVLAFAPLWPAAGLRFFAAPPQFRDSSLL